MKKKILIITTGGTIAMRYDNDFGVMPNDELVQMLHSFPQLEDISSIHVHEFTNVPSPYITPQLMLDLAHLVQSKISEYDGIVITHGTDTLEESAYFLNLVLNTNKPVVFTAAMRSGSELGLDGPRNIVGAVRVVIDENSRDRGVLVVMNDEINCARDVVKTDSGKTDAFVTPSYGILGVIDPDRIVYYRNSIIREYLPVEKIEKNIDLIKCVAGMEDHHIKASVDNNVKALVLEAFGRGNIPRSIIPAVKEAIKKGILVVITSRTYTGRVLPEYGYEGGGRNLREMGVIFGNDLKGTKMRLLLMILFGKFKDPDLVRDYLEKHR